METRQWYIANFARSRAGRSPWPRFLQFGRAKAVPLATPAKYSRVIGQQENSYISYIVYIAAWEIIQTNWSQYFAAAASARAK